VAPLSCLLTSEARAGWVGRGARPDRRSIPLPGRRQIRALPRRTRTMSVIRLCRPLRRGSWQASSRMRWRADRGARATHPTPVSDAMTPATLRSHETTELRRQ